MVHAGFKRAYDAIDMPLRRIVEREGLRHIDVLGHSLGAAVAALAARVLDGIYGNIQSATTLGCPRVGNAAFAAEYNAALGDKTVRIVNNNDVVARLPIRGDFLKWLPYAKLQAFLRTTGAFGWRHVGKLLYIGSDGLIYPEPSKLFTFTDGLRGRWDDFGKLGTDGLKDHFIDSYKVPLDPDGACRPCPPEGAICNGTEMIIVRPGYWRGNSTTDIYKCKASESICLGSQNSPDGEVSSPDSQPPRHEFIRRRNDAVFDRPVVVRHRIRVYELFRVDDAPLRHASPVSPLLPLHLTVSLGLIYPHPSHVCTREGLAVWIRIRRRLRRVRRKDR